MKFHFRTQQGIENLTDAAAETLVGKDRETSAFSPGILQKPPRPLMVFGDILPSQIHLKKGYSHKLLSLATAVSRVCSFLQKAKRT